MADLVFAPAHVQAAALRDRSLSAVELIDAHLTKIVRSNPQLNAIVTLDPDAARQHAHEADAALARGALPRARGILLGKTNLPPGGSDYQTNSPLFGRANNPWDRPRTPGGSSGGSCSWSARSLGLREQGGPQ